MPTASGECLRGQQSFSRSAVPSVALKPSSCAEKLRAMPRSSSRLTNYLAYDLGVSLRTQLRVGGACLASRVLGSPPATLQTRRARRIIASPTPESALLAVLLANESADSAVLGRDRLHAANRVSARLHASEAGVV